MGYPAVGFLSFLGVKKVGFLTKDVADIVYQPRLESGIMDGRSGRGRRAGSFGSGGVPDQEVRLRDLRGRSPLNNPSDKEVPDQRFLPMTM